MFKLIATFLLFFKLNVSSSKLLVKSNVYLNYKPYLTTENFNDWLRQTQKETELIDDQTEKTIKNNKLLFILTGLGFSWIVYQSLLAKKNK